MKAFDELRRRWPVVVDLFTISPNRCSSLFFSFPQSSSSRDGCAPPQLGPSPGVCVPSVGLDASGPRKLQSSYGVLMALLAPYWPQRPWFPDLLDLAVDHLIVFPHCPDLRQPHFHRRHLRVCRLSLLAWRLFSDLPGLQASLPL